MSKELDIKIGQLIRDFRQARGISQADLGKCLDITFQQVQKYERGYNRISISSLLEMLKFMNVTWVEFFEALETPLVLTGKDYHYVKGFLELSPKLRGRLISLVNTLKSDIVEAI